ncbi:MAG: hypothetical protein HRT57_08790 [Crocinitomicaceae bacterium]|nr:hypothetical protein [Crocinitomicaceae bacterium]
MPSSIKDSPIFKTTTHELFTVHLRTDGILHLHVHANTEITVAVQDDMKKAYDSLTKVNRPLISTGDEFVSVTQEAKEKTANQIDKSPIIGTTVVVKNLAQRLIIGFYLKFNNSDGSLNVVNDFEKGIRWIHSKYDVAPIL